MQQPVIDPKRLSVFLNLPILQGSHIDFDRGACLLEAIAFLAGEPHSDHPECACPVVSRWFRYLNDSLPDVATRNRLLRKKSLALKLLNSKSTAAVEKKRHWFLVDWSMRVFTARWLELANFGEAAEKLRQLPVVTEHNYEDVRKLLVKIRREVTGGIDYWEWREKRWAKTRAVVKATVEEHFAKQKIPAAAVAAVAAAAAAAVAAVAAAAAVAADVAVAANVAAVADAAADAAAVAAAAAAAVAAGQPPPDRDSLAWWSWREAFYAECKARFRARIEVALGPTLERSRVEMVEAGERALDIAE